MAGMDTSVKGSQCWLETETERKAGDVVEVREERQRVVAPKISETRERPPRLVGLVMREARRTREGESGVRDLGWVSVEVVEAGFSVVQVLDLVWRGRGWVGLMVRAVRAVSIVRGYSTGEVVVGAVAVVVPRGMNESPFSPSIPSTARKSAPVIRSIGSTPRRYVPWKIPRRV